VQGREAHFLVNRFPILDAAGALSGFGVVALETTAQKEAEAAAKKTAARLEAIMRNAPLVIHIKGLDRRYLMANPAAETLFGVPASGIVGRTAEAFFSPEVCRATERDDARVAETGDVVVSERDQPTHHRYRWSLSVKFPLFDEQGRVNAIGTFEYDLSDRKRAEEALRRSEAELRASKEQAEAASRAKTSFLANMSHELRTPLNGILGYAELILAGYAGPVDERTRGYLSSIHESGRHLLSLINEILDMARIEAGRLKLDEGEVEIGEAVAESVTAVEPQAQARTLDLRVAVEPGLPAVRGDGRMLKQILLNLLANAIKFTEPGGRVEVTAERGPGGGLSLAVADSGCGIEPEQLAHIFEPFQRGAADVRRKNAGTGLGLAISRRLAELHGGTLEVASEVGKGSRFTLRLPAERMLAAGEGGARAPRRLETSA
jgi:PAS domain S-box-containing protein